jgi:hypothetical protein
MNPAGTVTGARGDADDAADVETFAPDGAVDDAVFVDGAIFAREAHDAADIMVVGATGDGAAYESATHDAGFVVDDTGNTAHIRVIYRTGIDSTVPERHTCRDAVDSIQPAEEPDVRINEITRCIGSGIGTDGEILYLEAIGTE